MIISASYKTDIPCFYGNWFMNRLKEGFCIIKDAFTRKAKRVSLKQEDVDGIFFWTKDLSNFIDKFKEIRNMGYNFIVHHTIIKYPKEIELMRVDLESCIENLKLISEEFGNRVPVWRYDPIVFSSITDYDYHLRNFEFLSKKLEGITDEVIISFMQLYKKTERNLNLSSKKYNFKWFDPIIEKKINLANTLSSIAKAYGMKLSICAQSYLIEGDLKSAKCIDGKRLSDVLNRDLFVKQKGRRDGCMCDECIDIGEYDTCPFGCVYCYAVNNRKRAIRNYKNHKIDDVSLSAILYDSEKYNYEDKIGKQKKLF